jgi:hypothetical protein
MLRLDFLSLLAILAVPASLSAQATADSGPVKAKIVQRAIAYLNLSFALLEQAVRRGRMTPGASHLAFFNLGGGQTVSARMSPLGSDSLRLDIGDIRFHLRVDQQGRVLGGRIPSQNVVADRQ